MSHSHFRIALLALLVALGTTACASHEPMSRRKAQAPTVDMPVAALHAEAVIG